MRIWGIIGAMLLASAPLLAQSFDRAQVAALGDALRITQTLEVMQREAQRNADDLASDMLQPSSLPAWQDTISQLFDPARTRAAFDLAILSAADKIDKSELDEVMAFFAMPLGHKLVRLEIEARESLFDKSVERAAQESWAKLQSELLATKLARVDLINDIVQANDLIESNVSSALNGNFAFLQSLAEAGGLGTRMDEADMLAEVWSQEDEIRSETADWLYPYLNFAYAPLTDDELTAYIAFSKSAAGQSLNAVLFAAFDALGVQQSRGMGLAAGRLLAGQDI